MNLNESANPKDMLSGEGAGVLAHARHELVQTTHTCRQSFAPHRAHHIAASLEPVSGQDHHAATIEPESGGGRGGESMDCRLLHGVYYLIPRLALHTVQLIYDIAACICLLRASSNSPYHVWKQERLHGTYCARTVVLFCTPRTMRCSIRLSLPQAINPFHQFLI